MTPTHGAIDDLGDVDVVFEVGGVLPSSISEPSIITEPKAQVDGAPGRLAGLVPWSWCITSGMWG